MSVLSYSGALRATPRRGGGYAAPLPRSNENPIARHISAPVRARAVPAPTGAGRHSFRGTPPPAPPAGGRAPADRESDPERASDDPEQEQEDPDRREQEGKEEARQQQRQPEREGVQGRGRPDLCALRVLRLGLRMHGLLQHVDREVAELRPLARFAPIDRRRE